MRHLALAVVVLVFLRCGVLVAGEESILAMRGEPPVGSTTHNRFIAAADGVESTAQISAGRRNHGDRVARSIPPMRYLGWREPPARTVIALPDRTVEWSGQLGFDMTPRFVTKNREMNHEPFYLLMFRVLNGAALEAP